MDNVRKFVVSEAEKGMRLDKFLTNLLPEFSRNEIQKFEISDLNNPNRKLKSSDKVKLGEEFSVIIKSETKSTAVLSKSKTSNIDLDILYEDDDIIVVNKPRGIAMYPGAGHESETLVHAVLNHTSLSGIGGETNRPGIVHRIDKDTSGVVILAKSDSAHRNLTKTFSCHDLVRKYITFVWGIPNWESADITGNIARSARNRQKMTMVKFGGKDAQTHVSVMNIWPKNGISELRCVLDTGRTHQIRVHLSAHGFPVVCDTTYGRGNSRLGSVKNPNLLEFIKTHHGQMLHAEVLELKHPITEKLMKFHANLPEDMLDLRDILNGN